MLSKPLTALKINETTIICNRRVSLFVIALGSLLYQSVTCSKVVSSYKGNSFATRNHWPNYRPHLQMQDHQTGSLKWLKLIFKDDLSQPTRYVTGKSLIYTWCKSYHCFSFSIYIDT